MDDFEAPGVRRARGMRPHDMDDNKSDAKLWTPRPITKKLGSLGIDCDDVFSAFTARVIHLVHQETGRRYHEEDITQWDLFDFIGDKKLGRKIYDIIKSEGGCFGLDLIEGTKEGFDLVKQLFDETYVVTAPFIGSKTWVHERYRWIQHHLGIDHNFVAQTHAKHMFAVDVFVDDKVANVLKWTERRIPGRGIVWGRHANKLDVLPNWVTRVNNWHELYDLVYNMAHHISP